MPRYIVNATIAMPAWISVEADSPAEAFEEASNTPARYWETDTAAGDIEFDVTPQVEDDV